MNRRNFVRNGILAGTTLSTLSLLSCQLTPRQKSGDKQVSENISLDELTIPELQGKVKMGLLTYASMTQIYLDRIREIDRNGPGLNSVIEINPDAMAIAEKMDQERLEGKLRGPL